MVVYTFDFKYTERYKPWKSAYFYGRYCTQVNKSWIPFRFNCSTEIFSEDKIIDYITSRGRLGYSLESFSVDQMIKELGITESQSQIYSSGIHEDLIASKARAHNGTSDSLIVDVIKKRNIFFRPSYLEV